jgi:hypothetical protein
MVVTQYDMAMKTEVRETEPLEQAGSALRGAFSTMWLCTWLESMSSHLPDTG